MLELADKGQWNCKYVQGHKEKPIMMQALSREVERIKKSNGNPRNEKNNIWNENFMGWSFFLFLKFN